MNTYFDTVPGLKTKDTNSKGLISPTCSLFPRI